MDASTLIPILAIGTLVAVAILALISKAKTEERMHDPNAPKSTLAKDGPQGGVDFKDDKAGPSTTNDRR